MNALTNTGPTETLPTIINRAVAQLRKSADARNKHADALEDEGQMSASA